MHMQMPGRKRMKMMSSRGGGSIAAYERLRATLLCSRCAPAASELGAVDIARRIKGAPRGADFKLPPPVKKIAWIYF